MPEAFCEEPLSVYRNKVGDSVLYHVRRAKARFSSGCKSRPATFVPAGSNRSSGRGNEVAEAFGVEGHESDLVSMQAVTRVNAEQASIALGKVWRRGIRWRVC